jgi:toxin HigB-1
MAFRVEFEDADLALLELEAVPKLGWSNEVVRAYRKTMNIIRAATDERDLYALKGLRFEKLQPPRSHQHSMRLNLQWRLIVELPRDHPDKTIRIVAIEDYH